MYRGAKRRGQVPGTSEASAPQRGPAVPRTPLRARGPVPLLRGPTRTLQPEWGASGEHFVLLPGALSAHVSIFSCLRPHFRPCRPHAARASPGCVRKAAFHAYARGHPADGDPSQGRGGLGRPEAGTGPGLDGPTALRESAREARGIGEEEEREAGSVTWTTKPHGEANR